MKQIIGRWNSMSQVTQTGKHRGNSGNGDHPLVSGTGGGVVGAVGKAKLQRITRSKNNVSWSDERSRQFCGQLHVSLLTCSF